MKKGREIINSERFGLTLQRLAHEVLENFDIRDDIYLVGIQEKGVILAERLMDIMSDNKRTGKIHLGKLDITFYRDDFRMRATPIKANATEIDFDIEGKHIILIDDVLYTGRTIQAAMSALQDLGRAMQIQLLAMIDRRFNRHLPIKADFYGMRVDSLDEAYVKVEWGHRDEIDRVLIFSANEKDNR